MLHRNRTRAESFGGAAELYDRARPSYPPELIAALLEGGAPSVLDVGCGTGIASAQLAQAGCEVLGVEVDERMAEVARAKGIAVEVAPFERWEDRGRRFDLLTAAQAWHWVDPDRGAARAAEVLAPAGRFAAFWNLGQPPEEVRERLAPIYARLAPRLDYFGLAPPRDHDRVGATGTALDASGRFEPARESWFPWRRRYDTAAWVEFLASHSDHRTMPADTRERLLAAVGEAIDALGGAFDMVHETVLVSARLRPR